LTRSAFGSDARALVSARPGRFVGVHLITSTTALSLGRWSAAVSHFRLRVVEAAVFAGEDAAQSVDEQDADRVGAGPPR